MEVKYNVSSFDNTPVDRASAGPEVHTGRAVFVDEELYDSDASYKAKVDKCIEEGFHKVVEGESGGSGCDCDPGYECKEEWVTLTDESVTTAKAKESNPSAYASLAYSKLIKANTIRVTFNGKEYLCERNKDDYGAPFDDSTNSYDWSEYPFNIYSTNTPAGVYENSLDTEIAGTHQVKIEAFEETIETSECFEKARGYSCGGGIVTLVDATLNFATR